MYKIWPFPYAFLHCFGHVDELQDWLCGMGSDLFFVSVKEKINSLDYLSPLELIAFLVHAKMCIDSRFSPGTKCASAFYVMVIIFVHRRYHVPVSYTHLTLPTIYSV